MDSPSKLETFADNLGFPSSLPFSTRIAFTDVLQGYAILRVPLPPSLTQMKPSQIHEYLCSISKVVELTISNLNEAS